MKSLSAPLTTQKDGAQSGWCELYDIYLKAAITTPWGTLSTLRLTTLPGGLNFFTPLMDPEPAGTRGDAAAYSFWPIKREAARTKGKSANDQLRITASNVTAEWAAMLAGVDWYDTPIVVRKVSTTVVGATANDCAVIAIVLVDSAQITNQALQFVCSNDLSSFGTRLPAEDMHNTCRFQWADDLCTMIRFAAENYKAKTCAAGSSTTLVKSADFTEDTTQPPYLNEPVGVDHPNDSILLAAHSLAAGQMVKFDAAVAPAGITLGRWYYVYPATAFSFSVSEDSDGWPPIDITSNGTSVTICSEPPRGTDLIAPLANAAITTSSEQVGYEGYKVKAVSGSYWRMGSTADWGTCTQGVWQIPDAQAGRHNAALKPWIQFDMGVARRLGHWRLCGRSDADAETADMPRVILFFSSADATTWKFEGYFLMSPDVGRMHEVFIPGAASARYWRICVRSRWSEEARLSCFEIVSGYAELGNWWGYGTIKFAADTLTPALRGVSRLVLESYAGAALVRALPVAPAAGDTFIIERGCPRTFNGCAERQPNLLNFGGQESTPFESTPR